MTQQQEVLALFYLCYCKLNHIFPDRQRTKGLDISQLYQISVYHDIGAIVCMALESAGILDNADPQTAKAFRNIRNKSLRKVLLLDNGRAEIFRFLDENKIWHMPLKGVILKDYYPELGMRQMSDNDILYDAAFRKTMQQYMLSQGYTLGAKKAYEDDYFKLPVYNYEMHLSYRRGLLPLLHGARCQALPFRRNRVAASAGLLCFFVEKAGHHGLELSALRAGKARAG